MQKYMEEEKKDLNGEENTEKNEEKEIVNGEDEKNTEEEQHDEEEKEEEEKEEDKEEEEDNPYRKQLKKYEEDAKKKEEMLRQKTGAIKQERQKRQELEKKLKEDGFYTKQEIEALLDERLGAIKTEEKIREVSSSDDEAKLIQKIMDEKKVSVDDAKILANAHLIDEYKQRVENDSWNEMSGSMAGISAGQPRRPAYENDPSLKIAAKELPPEVRKYLGNN